MDPAVEPVVDSPAQPTAPADAGAAGPPPVRADERDGQVHALVDSIHDLEVDPPAPPR